MNKLNFILLIALLSAGIDLAAGATSVTDIASAVNAPAVSTAKYAVFADHAAPTAISPSDSLGIGTYKGLKVVMHQVGPKETFYSVARRYNVHPKYLIRFNTHIQGLKIGDTIRLEVDSMNSFQNLVLVPDNDQEAVQTDEDTVSAPPQSTVIEHVVAPRETLFAIARQYGLTVATLRTLNSLPDSHIETGQRLIVSASGPIASDPGQLEEVAKAGKSAAAEAEDHATAEEEPEEEKVYTSTPTPVLGTPDQVAKSGSENKDNKDLPKLVRQVKESGVAAWLSNSSLNQAKSVALHNTVPSGTIVKVTNPANQRSIMVKVVGAIPQNAETENALIIISQSASQLLGIRDNRFRVNLTYAIQE